MPCKLCFCTNNFSMKYFRKFKTILTRFLMILILMMIIYNGLILPNSRHLISQVMFHKHGLIQPNSRHLISQVVFNKNSPVLTSKPHPGVEHSQVVHGHSLANLTSSTPSLNSIRVEMGKRREHLSKVCKKLSLGRSAQTFPRALVSVNKRVIYCPVEKAASTFFRRILFQLEYLNQISSPFRIPVKMIYKCPAVLTRIEDLDKHWTVKNKKKNRRLTKTEIIKTFLKSSLNFMFVRDPYSRLFSVYVDKVLSPNPEFWEKWGTLAVKKFRTKPSELSLRCGHDVTFTEFLKFILSHAPASLDPHLRPIVYLCQPCQTRYDVIGHMTTFERDVTYLASLFNITDTQSINDKMSAEMSLDAIEDSVIEPFTEWAPKIMKCISRSDAAKLIWRKLQLRGIISSKLEFSNHVKNDVINEMEAVEFVEILKKALEQSKDLKELQRQKHEALLEAYRSVNPEILKKIKKVYSADVKLFGFKDQIQEVIDEQSNEDFNIADVLSGSKTWIF